MLKEGINGFCMALADSVPGVFGGTVVFSRLYLYVHYPTDILGGILVGITAGYAGNVIVRQCVERKKGHPFGKK